MSDALDQLAAAVQALGKTIAEMRKQEAADKAKAEREERKREAQWRKATAWMPPRSVPEAPLLTVKEAAAFLKVGRSKMYELRSAGEVESVKMNGKRLFIRESLLAYVNRLREAS